MIRSEWGDGDNRGFTADTEAGHNIFVTMTHVEEGAEHLWGVTLRSENYAHDHWTSEGRSYNSREDALNRYEGLRGTYG